MPFLVIFEATVVVNGCIEEKETLMPFQRINCKIVSWYLRKIQCVLEHQRLLLRAVWWITPVTWEAIAWVLVIAVVIVSIRSLKIVQWLLNNLGCVPMAHGRTTMAIVVQKTWLLGMLCSAILTIMSAFSSNMVLLAVDLNLASLYLFSDEKALLI